ncbi:MAG: hypothetical protein ACK4NS_00060 [Saprospiraceae bacterium]
MNNPDYDEIELYLRDGMPAEQRAAFEARLQSDAALREEALFYEAVLAQSDAAFKQEMATLGKELLNKEDEQPPLQVSFKSLQRRLLMRYAAAASILLMATVGLWRAIGVDNKLSQLPDQDYQTYALSGSLGADEFTADKTALVRGKAASLYAARRYADALPLLESLSTDEIYGPQALMMKGCAFYETGSYAQALKAFDAVPPNAQSLRKIADYYAVLALIKLGDFDAASSRLSAIAQDPDSPWQDRAADALKRRKR